MENRFSFLFGRGKATETQRRDKKQAESNDLINLETSLKSKIQNSIDSIFPHPNIEARDLKDPELYWGDYMPESCKDSPELAEYEAILIMIQKFDYFGYIRMLVHFGIGSITMEYYPESGKSKTETQYTNKIKENITLASKSEDRLSNTIRLTRISEAFSYYNAIREHRNQQGISSMQEGLDD